MRATPAPVPRIVSADPTQWHPPRREVRLYAGFDLVFFGGALMFAAIVCAIWALWMPLMLVFVPPFVACAAVAWWRWLSFRIVVGPKEVRIGRMFGSAHRIPFASIVRVRFLRARSEGLRVDWSAGVSKGVQVPFESPGRHRRLEGAPVQVWIERRSGTPAEVRLNLDFLQHPSDVQRLYESLPHVVSPPIVEVTGPRESLPSWW